MGFCLFFLLNSMGSLYILDTHPLGTWFANTFSSSVKLPFHFADGFLCCAIVFQFGVVPLVHFCFCCLCFGCHVQKVIAKTNAKEIFPCFFL